LCIRDCEKEIFLFPGKYKGAYDGHNTKKNIKELKNIVHRGIMNKKEILEESIICQF